MIGVNDRVNDTGAEKRFISGIKVDNGIKSDFFNSLTEIPPFPGRSSVPYLIRQVFPSSITMTHALDGRLAPFSVTFSFFKLRSKV